MDLHVGYLEENKLFRVSDYSIIDLPAGLVFEHGAVFERVGDVFTRIELTEEQKREFSQDEALRKHLNELIVSSCTGKIIYDVAWWAVYFNQFVEGFTYLHFEV